MRCSSAPRTRMRASSSRSTSPTRITMPGVVGIFSGKDIEGKMGGLPCGWLINNPDGTPMKEPMHPILAINKVRYVGDHVAMVVAETVEQAKNAAEAVVVEYEVLPALVERGRRGEESRRRHDPRRGARQPVLQVGAGRQGGGRCRLRGRRARHEARPGQQPADSQPDRAARGHRQLQPRHRRLHALRLEPEPARRAAA